jgi:hypothetical protein
MEIDVINPFILVNAAPSNLHHLMLNDQGYKCQYKWFVAAQDILKQKFVEI